MRVIKRDGRSEPVKFDKITLRIQKLCQGLDSKYVDPRAIAIRVIQGVHDGVSTSSLDVLAAETAASMTMQHPDFSKLAARIAVSNLHKMTSVSFVDTLERLHSHRNRRTDEPAPLVCDSLLAVARLHRERIEGALEYHRDLEFDYFGFKTLERGYLLRINGEVVERPQHMLMRVALGIHDQDIEAALETYELMSAGMFVHATPTMFNAGTPSPQMSSCFLLAMRDDSIEGIFETLGDCALISKSAGGVGLAISSIRAKGTYIKGSGGISNGLVPMLRVFDATARYVDQGGGKRKGAFACYIEPWHADILDVLELKKNHGKEEARARDLFYALWVPDLFMRRVEANAEWSLFCPSEAPDLHLTHGAAFEELYERYEREGRARRTLPAQRLWTAILDAQIETGVPYMLYKDAANSKSNQSHLGTIRCSNLCTEIIEYTAPDEVAVCNLASLALPRYVRDGAFDHERLRQVVHVVTRNLNRVIDRNAYPVPEAETSNRRHRPIGIGVQGLADAFLLLRLPFDSEGARALNRDIFETIYFAALDASCALAQQDGAYESYPGSPMSRGKLQFDLWGVAPSGRWDWAELRARIDRYGVRNSLLVAPMPTASTAQILGNNECFEPYISNVFTRRVLAGEFAVVNQHLLRDLIAHGLWDDGMRNAIVAADGSVQKIDSIPDELKLLYRTAWELKMRALVDMAADRGAFICQSQSLNCFMTQPNYSKLSSMHFHAWRKGLKTGMYYLRTRAAADAIKFTVEPTTCTRASGGECEACGA